MRKYILFLLFLCMHGMARGQAGYDYRYWFDNNLSTVHQGHAESGKWQIEADIKGMSEAIHAIHIQATDSKGNESASVTRYFQITHDKSADKGYYWFDRNSTSRRQSALMQGAFSIDVSELSDGFHMLYYQVAGKDGSLSAVASRPFVKIPQTDGVEYLKCLCYIDDEFYTAEDVPSAGGVINWSLDVSSLSEGIHKIMVQVMTPSGAATSTYEAEFLRTAMVDGIFDVTIVDDETEEAGYRINGQRARKTDKGLIIKKGKKHIVK